MKRQHAWTLELELPKQWELKEVRLKEDDAFKT